MFIASCILAGTLAAVPVPVKQLGCPPSDLARGWMQEPTPAKHGARSSHGVLPFTFEDGSCMIQVEVSTGSQLRLLPVGIGSENWTIHAIEPTGQVHAGDGPRSRLVRGLLAKGVDGSGIRLDILDPAPGTWRVVIEGDRGTESGQLWVSDGNPLHLRAWLEDASTIIGQPVGIGLGLADIEHVSMHGDLAAARAQAGGASILQGTARLLWQDGSEDALSIEGNRIQFTPARTGIGTVIIDALAADGEGQRMHRTTSLMVSIEKAPPLLTGSVTLDVLDAHRVACRLEVIDSGERDRVLAGAEVWAAGPGGVLPRCWIGGITPVEDGVVELVLDTRWLAEAGCDGHGVELRLVRLADVDSFVPLDRMDVMGLGSIEVSRGDISPAGRRAMQMGAGDRVIEVPGLQLPERANIGSHALMLSHGYCSDGDSWPPSHFTGEVAVYNNTEQNFTHDEFALDIWSWGNNFKSYSVVGHSQGGNAGLHLYSLYWSGMDWSTGNRRVQVLGTPLQGTILAGDIAALGEIFGIQCGANYDMTYDGAAQWISWLPGWARAETWAWSTTFTDVWWWYDFCHVLSDLVLWDPEDGVVEAWAAHLDGTNDMGTKEGWCHIEDMVDPPQVYDTARNNEINSEGAR